MGATRLKGIGRHASDDGREDGGWLPIGIWPLRRLSFGSRAAGETRRKGGQWKGMRVATWAWMKVRPVPGHADVAEGESVARRTSDGGVDEQMSERAGRYCESR